jgi:hypothetical protein
MSVWCLFGKNQIKQIWGKKTRVRWKKQQILTPNSNKYGWKVIIIEDLETFQINFESLKSLLPRLKLNSNVQYMYREMIFEHPFDDNFLSHTHIIFYFISLLLWFLCKYLLFLCKWWLSNKLSTKLIV